MDRFTKARAIVWQDNSQTTTQCEQNVSAQPSRFPVKTVCYTKGPLLYVPSPPRLHMCGLFEKVTVKGSHRDVLCSREYYRRMRDVALSLGPPEAGLQFMLHHVAAHVGHCKVL